jgi:aryl-alcohol dehydrogenase-like predicted oxidoreductase
MAEHRTKSVALLLGTAGWGWTVAKAEAFRLLDHWLANGHRDLDCATNYPINRQAADFRAAERILLEYLAAHGIGDLRLTMKIGSLDNLRSPEPNLSPSFLRMMGEEYLRLFGTNLRTLMLHWDNRQQPADIRDTLEAQQQMQQQLGIQPGWSGIAHPEAYAEANAALGLSCDIQLKHNVLHSDLPRYRPLAEAPPRHRFFAYGINAGGLKLDGAYPPGSTLAQRGGPSPQGQALVEKLNAWLPKLNTDFVRPPVKTMNHLGLIHAALQPGLQGIVLGASTPAQLRETLDYLRNVEIFDYSDVFTRLQKIMMDG